MTVLCQASKTVVNDHVPSDMVHRSESVLEESCIVAEQTPSETDCQSGLLANSETGLPSSKHESSGDDDRKDDGEGFKHSASGTKGVSNSNTKTEQHVPEQVSKRFAVEYSIEGIFAEGSSGRVALGRRRKIHLLDEVQLASSNNISLSVVDNNELLQGKVVLIERVVDSVGVLQSENEEIALKVLACEVTEEDHIVIPSLVQKEIEIMRAVCSKGSNFVVKFHFDHVFESQIYIGMECCPADLFRLLNMHEIQDFEILFYLAEIISGLNHLHENNIVHGDLKPENIAISQNGHVRLIDFGLSRILDPETDRNPENNHLEVVTESGTVPYCAPEILQRHRHGFESDWWSIGVILFEMRYSSLPWYTEDDLQTCYMICTEPLQVPSDAHFPSDDICFDLIEKLLTKPQTERLGYQNGFQEVKSHPWFCNVDWQLLESLEYAPPFIVDGA